MKKLDWIKKLSWPCQGGKLGHTPAAQADSALSDSNKEIQTWGNQTHRFEKQVLKAPAAALVCTEQVYTSVLGSHHKNSV